MEQHKICSKCKIDKPLSEYSKDSHTISGHDHRCKICSRKRSKFYRIKNAEKRSAYDKKYRNKKREQINAQRRKNKRKRWHSDTAFRMESLIRKRVNQFLTKKTRSAKTMELLGCDIDFLKIYLQYTAYANYYLDFDIENYSSKEYHIDHIVPCASFDLSDSKQQKQCFHYSNLQILGAKENISKGAGYGN